MANYGTFRLILRVSVIILIISFNNNKVRNGVVAATQLVFEPLWDMTDSLNGTDQCFIEQNAMDGTVLFRGSSDRLCSLQVTATQGSHIQLQVLGNTNDSIGSSFLYVESLGNLNVCLNKYIVFEDQSKECMSILSHSTVLVVLIGVSDVFVRSIPIMEILPECPELNTSRHDQNVSHTSICNSIKGYNSKIDCVPSIGSDCRLNFQADNNCQAILGRREVTYQCTEHSPLQNHADLIVYSSKVTVLDLSSNKLAQIHANSFVGLGTLGTLYLRNNNLSYQSLSSGLFENLNDLEFLNLADNMFSILPTFRDLTNLQELYLENNVITDLTDDLFLGLHKLRILSISSNLLTSITGGVFQDLVNLEELRLNENNISKLSENSFQGLKNLKTLNLWSNNVQEVKKGVFTNLTNLQTLLLISTKLRTMQEGSWEGLFNLIQLHLLYNEITHLYDAFLFGLNNLIILSLGDNRITTLPNNLFIRSTDEIRTEVSNKLLFLFLDTNYIQTIPSTFFQGLHNLELLHFDRNKLSSLSPGMFRDLRNLKRLSLGENLFVQIPTGAFDGLTNLIDLNLNKCPLQSLESDSFRGIDNVLVLLLTNFTSIRLNGDLFKNLVHLRRIDFYNSNLQNIPNIDHLQQLTFLYLRGNPLTQISHSSLNSLTNKTDVFADQQEICECYVPPNTYCSAAFKRSPYLTCDRLLADRALAVTMWLMGINALGGNLFVLIWRWYKRDSQSNKVNTMLLSNLATSDLLMGIYLLTIASADVHYGENFPMQSETWRSGITCRIAGALSITASEASVFFVMLISIDRFICIRFPYSTKRIGKKSAAIIATIIWLTSFVLGIVPSILSGRNFKFYDNSHVCIGLPLALTKTFIHTGTPRNIVINDGDQSGIVFGIKLLTFTTRPSGFVNGLYFATAMFLGLNCVCYLIILACYVEIVRAVKKSSEKVGRNRDMKEQITLTVKVTSIVATDFFCWFPIIVLGILVQARVITLPASVYAWCVTFRVTYQFCYQPIFVYCFGDNFQFTKGKIQERENAKKSPSPK